MVELGYHASHEQFRPSELVELACRAETAGFDAVLASDHWAPWSVRQGQSGFCWSWLGAAMHASKLPFCVVTAPGQRYHPAIIAQAVATLAEMFPGRFSVALGSGEALNEHITGDRWPDKPTRDQRWDECASVIGQLLDGGEVSHRGLVQVDRARLWTLPDQRPAVRAAAVSATSAARAADWANGLVTLYRQPSELASVIDAFRQRAAPDATVHVQVHLAWSDVEADAAAAAHDQWRTNVFGGSIAWNLELPEQFDEAARFVDPDDVRSAVLVSSSPSQHIDWISELIDLGVDGVYLHQVGRDQQRFIDVFGECVLPAFARRGS